MVGPVNSSIKNQLVVGAMKMSVSATDQSQILSHQSEIQCQSKITDQKY